MDQELKQAIEAVTSAAREATAAAQTATAAADSAATAANGAREGLNELRNLAVQNHQSTQRQIIAINRNFGVLWKRVHGSDPPPPDPGSAPAEEAPRVEIGPDGSVVVTPSVPPLDEVASTAFEKASQASLELAALESRMISGFTATNTRIESTTASTNNRVEDALKELRKQSSAMGVGKAGVRWLFGTREGWKTVGILVAGLGGVYAALRPHEHAPAPAPQVIVVAAPTSSAAPPPR